MMAKRIFEKAELIPGFQPGAKPPPAPNERDGKSKTAPGTMMGFLTAQSTAAKEAELLRAEVKSLQQASPLRKLDPSQVRPSKWANRHATSFATGEFEMLKAEILAAGENVQPIKVRPLAESATESNAGSMPQFEVVFGHRRHRACLELGIPVSAVVENVDDVGLFQQMERENRGRKNLSAWEQGRMYGKALDEGLFPSQRKLAESLGVDLALVSKSLALARLPDEVVQTFSSPLDIQFRWAAALGDAVQKDPDGVLARAREVRSEAVKAKPLDIFERLIRVDPGSEAVSGSVTLHKDSKAVGVLRIDVAGKVQLSLKAGALQRKHLKPLAKLIEELLER